MSTSLFLYYSVQCETRDVTVQVSKDVTVGLYNTRCSQICGRITKSPLLEQHWVWSLLTSSVQCFPENMCVCACACVHHQLLSVYELVPFPQIFHSHAQWWHVWEDPTLYVAWLECLIWHVPRRGWRQALGKQGHHCLCVSCILLSPSVLCYVALGLPFLGVTLGYSVHDLSAFLLLLLQCPYRPSRLPGTPTPGVYWESSLGRGISQFQSWCCVNRTSRDLL